MDDGFVTGGHNRDRRPRQYAGGKAMDQQYELRLVGEPVRRTRARPAARRGAALPDRQNPTIKSPAISGSANGQALKSAARAVKARPAFLLPSVSADDAFRLTLQQCKWHIIANVPAVLEAHAPEGVHQLRVALRRLRVALASFDEKFRAPPMEALRMRAQILAQGLAPARDLDVFMDELFEPAARANGSVEAFAVLRERAGAARREAWADAVREVSGLAFRTFLHDLGEAVDEKLWCDGLRGLVAFEQPATDLANRVLGHRLKAAKKRARQLESLNEAERHRLRIALKKLRYTAEFFAPLYPADAVAPFIKRLSQMQDILGLLQDVAVARKTLAHLIEEPPEERRGPRADLSFAAGIVYGWHLDRSANAWSEAVSRWKRFAKAKPFWA